MRHVALVVTLATVVAGSVFMWPASAHVTRIRTTGDKLQIVNGRDGLPIFTVTKMAPGDSGSGEVTLSNSGVFPASLLLTTTRVADVPGLNGGRLSDVLRLRVEDMTGAAPAVVFEGLIHLGDKLPLAPLPPRGSRTFRFTVTLPDGGRPSSNATGDNAFEGSELQVDFTWTASGRDEDDEPHQQPQPQPGTAATGTVTPVGSTLTFPLATSPSSQRRARQCLSRRRFTIRLRETRHRRLRSAQVVVDGRRVEVRRRHGRLTALVDLRGVRRQTVRVKIVARTRAGRRLVGTRVYRTCTAKLIGKRPPRL